MKLYNKIVIGAVMFTSLSCTKDFDELNTSPNQPAVATPSQLFTTAQYNFADNIGDAWNNGRMGMYYSQYWSSSYYSEESRYQIREGVNQTMWNTFYADVINELTEAQKIDQEEKINGFENRTAIAEIFKALTYHYISDIYGGPIPLTEAVNPEISTPKYNSGEEVYATLLSDLETQIAILDPDKPSYTTGDVIYGGDVAKWKKFANSLRLRMALRMIDAKPDEAIAAIQKSLDPANGGIISSNDESALFRWVAGAPNNNPIAQAWKERQDFTMSEPFINYLKKYSDPRLEVYAEPLAGTSEYKGEAYGLRNGNGSSNANPKIVSLPSTYAIGETSPTIILNYAEVEFMLAEIAARGLSVANFTGTAESHYEAGIKASFDDAGLSNAAYTTYLAKVPYVQANWKDAIGTQKWIAMYTEGIQGWLERLRLDFKDPYTGAQIFALPADGTLDPDVTVVPTRMSYPVTEASLNGTNYQAALQLIGGKNSKAAKSWWDKF